MLLGWPLLDKYAREFDSIGDEGLLRICLCVEPGGLSTSSMLRTGGGGGLSTSSMLRTGAVWVGLGIFNVGTDLDFLGKDGWLPISSMLRTGERGVVKGEGDRAPNEFGAFGRAAALPSRRARTSLRSSSSIASIDIAWC